MTSLCLDVEAWTSRCSHGGDGLDVGRVCGRLHCEGHRRVCDATERNGKQQTTGLYCRSELTFSIGQGVSVEAVDPVFQMKMLDMLKQTGRPEMVVGWYHSHPGFGCWLSGVDINTQQVAMSVHVFVRLTASMHM